jgi:hypothetical protein
LLLAFRAHDLFGRGSLMAGTLTTPRPRPGRLVPALAAAGVIVLALPIFVAADWPLSGWLIGALLWIVAGQGLGLLLARLPIGADNLARSGVLAFGMTFRAIAVVVALVALAMSDTSAGVAAAIVYALGYTFELGIGLLFYFTGKPA